MQALHTENAAAVDLDQQSTKFLFCLFQQLTKSSIYESVLVSALAVCGLREDGGFAAPSAYTQIYAALLKTSYWLILAHSMEEDQQEDSPGLFYLVKAKLAQCIQPMNCPLFWVCRMLAYGRKVASDTVPESQVTWLGDTIQYQKISFDMVQLCSIIASLIHQARSDLAKLVQSDTLDRLPPIPWDRIVDNCGEQKVGYSFASEGDNSWLSPMNSLVYNKIMSDATLLDKWLVTTDEATLQFEQREVSHYKLLLDEFREKLLALVHLSAGQPDLMANQNLWVFLYKTRGNCTVLFGTHVVAIFTAFQWQNPPQLHASTISPNLGASTAATPSPPLAVLVHHHFHRSKAFQRSL
jgi:hypothetical protein